MPRKTLVAALSIVVLAVGCTVPGTPSAAPGPQPDRVTAAVTERLAAAGIAVHPAPGAEPLVPPAAPVSPMRLLEWQVRSMALEAAGHGGVTAASLDREVPGVEISSATLTASELIAGWAKHGESPAAGYARELLGDGVDDSAHAVFPQLVTVLFTSDLAVAGAAVAASAPAEPAPPEPTTSRREPTEPTEPSEPSSTTPPTGEPGPPVTTEPAPAESAAPPIALPAHTAPLGPCSSAVDFVDRTIAAVFNAIGHLAQPPQLRGGGVLGPLAAVVNAIGKSLVGAANLVVDGASLVVRDVGRVAISTLLAPVARIAGDLGTIAQVTSVVRPWTVVLTADPARNRKAVGSEAPVPGSVTARVDLGGLDEWPPFLADCAAQAGVPLPSLKPAGNPVSWTYSGTSPDLVTADQQRSTLDEDASSTVGYHTTVEPEYRNPTEVVGLVWANATVARDDVTELQQAVVTLIQDGLASLLPPAGDVVAPLVLPVVQPIIAKAFATLAGLRDAGGTVNVLIGYHTEGEDEPVPSRPPVAGPEPPAGRVPPSCPSANAISSATGLPFTGPELDEPVGPDAELECVYFYERVGGGLDIEVAAVRITYLSTPPSRAADVVSPFESVLGPCAPIAIRGARTACSFGNSDNALAQLIVATEKSVFVANATGGRIVEPGTASRASLRDLVVAVAHVVIGAER